MSESRDLVLSVPNHHLAGCGKPPGITASGHYTAYFENSHGEQLVFTYDPSKKEGTLWHGDYNWEAPLQVLDGEVSAIVLGSEESLWLKLVWGVATKQPSLAEKEVLFQYLKKLELAKEFKRLLGEAAKQ